jgi:hypothetical protein
MKTLVLKYLNMRYPNFYYKRTKFGPCAYNLGEPFSVLGAADELGNMFCIDRKSSFNILQEWLATRPIVDAIPNSTNLDVLIFV